MKNFLWLKFILVCLFNPTQSQLNNHYNDLFDVYTPIYGYDISVSDQSLYLIRTSSIESKNECYQKCTELENCKMVSIKSSQCSLFSQIKYSVSSSALNSNPCLFQKFDPDFSTITPYLQHYWPFNNNLNDIISGMNLYGGTGYSFAKDRLNKASGALYLNNQYLQAPSGVYFNGDFTVSAWIYPYRIIYADRLIDFGNGPTIHNVIIGFSLNSGVNNPFAMSFTNNAESNIVSTVLLKLNKWQHVSFSVSGSTGFFYINGQLTGQGNSLSPFGVVRTSNFIGRCNNPGSYDVKVLIDDLKFFNKSFNQQEVIKNMNSYF